MNLGKKISPTIRKNRNNTYSVYRPNSYDGYDNVDPYQYTSNPHECMEYYRHVPIVEVPHEVVQEIQHFIEVEMPQVYTHHSAIERWGEAESLEALGAEWMLKIYSDY